MYLLYRWIAKRQAIFRPGAAHDPVLLKEFPQIMPVNDGIVDPELVPEMAQNAIPGTQQRSGKSFC